MTIRLLASIDSVHCPVPLRDVLSNLITHTEYLPERHIYAAVLTREQWNLIREQYWATGRMCEHGRIVPDIDFVAEDGKVFTDLAECQKHEAEIKTQAGETVNAPGFEPDIAGSTPAPADISERLNTPEKLDAEIKRVTGQIEHLEAVTPPQTLEDRMLVVVGSNYMAISLVASLLKVDESAVRAVVDSSGKFKLSGTGKSIAKLAD
jgi:nitrite reductase/ring-hydroxylating ferredoxin subunit